MKIIFILSRCQFFFLIVMISKLIHYSWSDVCEEFLFACRHGDLLTIERLIRDGSIRKEDICKRFGAEQRSGIAVAIEQNHQSVVRFLLDQMSYEDLRESLLLSIYLDSTDVALMIINHPTFNHFNESSTDATETFNNMLNESHFDGVQPIQLAAQHGRLTILYELLKRGKTSDKIVRFVFVRFVFHWNFLANVSKCHILFNVNATCVFQLVSPIV